MPRQILNTKASIDIDSNKNLGTQLKSGAIVSDRILLQKRSKKYIQAMTSLDQGTLTAIRGYAELVEKIINEFGELGITEYPVGVVSKCFLGHPYEVHTLNLASARPPSPNEKYDSIPSLQSNASTVVVDIVNHYKQNEKMPDGLEKAHFLALNNDYVIIEVYPNKMILIKEDGTTTKL